MNRNYLLLFIFIACIACNKSTEIPARLSLPAEYFGMIPCADCMEIDYELTLQKNFIFEERRTYAGKSDSVFTETGRWMVINDSVIAIKKKGNEEIQFLVDSAALIMLDKEGNRIEGGSAEMYYLKVGSRKNLAQFSSNASIDPYVAKRVAGIDFIGSGNEPYWTLEINYESKMHFKVLDGPDIFMEIPAAIPDGNQMMYVSEMEGRSFEAILIAEPCADNMSGEKKDIRVICNYDGVTYNGCGVYLTPKYKLNGAWQLQMLLGTDLKKNTVSTPVLIIDVAQNKVNGNAGCNTYAASAKISETEITVSDKIATSLMACENSIEQDYLKQLSATTYRYMLINNTTLRLTAGDVVTMDFVRPAVQ